MTDFHIRRAQAGEESVILALLRDLADYEKLLHRFQITDAVIRRDYLCEHPLLNCDLAFADAKPVGLATWYWTYASFAATRGIYLEDLFVRPEYRGKGYGKMLLAHLAKTAVDAGASRVEWQVLPWNEPSIEFYELLGAERLNDWYVYRLTDAPLKKLGGG
jgi:GNAT superfamily N-acetyltransferase